MAIFLSIVILVAGFILLTKGASWLIDGSSSFARKLGVSTIIVGLTIVAFGTSLPEFIVSIFAAIQGNFDISVSNIVGSNIVNIGLIIGLSAVIAPFAIKERTLIYEFPFLIVSALFLIILSNDNNIFNKNTFSLGRIDGIIFLLILVVFIFYVVSQYRNREPLFVEKEFEARFKKRKKTWQDLALMTIGSISLFIGGRLIVLSAVDIATFLGVSQRFIGLTIVAIGTSLPELSTNVIAILKKQADIAVGNIVGSNILNILFVGGLVSLVKPLTVNPQLVYFDMIIMLVFSIVFLLFATTGKKTTRLEGATLLAGYIAYFYYITILR